MELNNKDVIVALASPAGVGAIHTIRMSGSGCFSILHKVIQLKRATEDVTEKVRLHGFFVGKEKKPASKKIIDQIVVHLYRNPYSYTGEDLVEINCHGSPYVVDKIITTLLDYGARMAEAGEFTKRAFLNGKIDLVQAEAIADLISAKTAISGDHCVDDLTGKLSNHLKEIQNKLKSICARLELDLDFSEEDIRIDKTVTAREIRSVTRTINRLIYGFRYGQIIREGFHVVIVGRPNVGKSSLMNKLLRSKRAIVSPQPGTTRDTIEEQIHLGGYLFKVSDTAGLRKYRDAIEKSGIERTKKTMAQADLLLLLLDGSEELQTDDREILRQLQKYKSKEKLLVINKNDLPQKVHIDDAGRFFQQNEYLQISSKTGRGVRRLEKTLIAMINRYKNDKIIISRARHLNALKRAAQCLHSALGSLHRRLSAEFIVFDLRAAMSHLGEITGEVTSEEIIHEIFSSFCIGK